MENISDIVINNKQLYAAYKDLTPSELAVWLYCVEYKILDKNGVMRNYGISEHAYNNAIKSLKQKQYITNKGFNSCPKPVEYNFDDMIANISAKQKAIIEIKPKIKNKYTIIDKK